MGHILYLAACLADEAITVEDEQALGELRAAQEHWNARVATNAVSAATRDRANTIGIAINEAITEFAAWNDRNKLQNIRDLGNRIIAYTCDLDRELIGITTSDPGSSL
jgi:YD repeat-containing protein